VFTHGRSPLLSLYAQRISKSNKKTKIFLPSAFMIHESALFFKVAKLRAEGRFDQAGSPKGRFTRTSLAPAATRSATTS
jgi:hypothetical protein